MSESSFWDIKDSQLCEILSVYECGGSARGDYVCLWRDNMTGEMYRREYGVLSAALVVMQVMV